jgi:hypothetical protein
MSYEEVVKFRIDLARKYLRAAKELISDFLAEDKKGTQRIDACAERGDELGLFSFSATETVDVESLRQPFEDHLESVKEDVASVVDLRKEAQEADEEEAADEEEEDSDDDGDEDDDEELGDDED